MNGGTGPTIHGAKIGDAGCAVKGQTMTLRQAMSDWAEPASSERYVRDGGPRRQCREASAGRRNSASVSGVTASIQARSPSSSLNP